MMGRGKLELKRRRQKDTNLERGKEKDCCGI